MTTTVSQQFNDKLSSASQIWIAPGSKNNIKKSIDNRMNVGDDKFEYAWALNKRFRFRFDDLHVGDAIVFGNATQKNIRVSFVKEKLQDMTSFQEWPYKAKTWGYGFYLSKPTVLNISYKEVVSVTDYNMFPTQLKLEGLNSKKVIDLILSK